MIAYVLFLKQDTVWSVFLRSCMRVHAVCARPARLIVAEISVHLFSVCAARLTFAARRQKVGIPVASTIGVPSSDPSR